MILHTYLNLISVHRFHTPPERAAEIDRAVHREFTREGSMARSRMLFEMTRGNDEEETKSSNSLKRRSVQIEMGTSSSPSLNGNDDTFGLVDSKEEECGETPFKL